MNLKKIALVFWASLICIAQSACSITTTSYPEGWETLPSQAPGNCTHFEDVIEPLGEDNLKKKASLSYLLFGFKPFGNNEWVNVTRIEFLLSDNEHLTITGWKETTPLITNKLSRSKGEFECNKGNLILTMKKLGVSTLVIGVEKKTFTFYQTANYIVVEVKDSANGLAVVIPVTSISRKWYRFKRLEH